MDSAIKLLLLFLVIFFLIFNSKEDQTTSGTVALNSSTMQNGLHYSFDVPEKKDPYY